MKGANTASYTPVTIDRSKSHARDIILIMSSKGELVGEYTIKGNTKMYYLENNDRKVTTEIRVVIEASMGLPYVSSPIQTMKAQNSQISAIMIRLQEVGSNGYLPET